MQLAVAMQPRAIVIAVLLSAATAEATPPLTQPNWTSVPYVARDPQIAVGPNHVVIGESSTVYIYDKTGTQLWTSSVADLFKPFWDSSVANNLNDHLNLPSGAKCYRDDPMSSQVGNDWNYCLGTWYDARALYDEKRDRFVIVALARNDAARCSGNPTPNFDARRSKVVVAYSKTPDPTAGWNLSWFDAVPGESCTTSSCTGYGYYAPGDAADYPSIALVENVLMVSVINQSKPTSCSSGNYPDKSAAVLVHSADGLATLDFTPAGCNGLCNWEYFGDDLKGATGYTDGSQVISWVGVANTHGDSYMGHGWFAQRDKLTSADKLDVWHFYAREVLTKPQLYRSTATLPAFDNGDQNAIQATYAQPPTASSPSPGQLTVTFTKGFVQRDQYLYFSDVGGMNGEGPKPDASIRLVGLIPNATTTSNVTFTLGRNAIFHVLGEGYGSPGIEVDAQRNIVLTYSKFGVSASNPSSLTGFGARYLTWPAGDTTPPTGRSLADNKDTLSAGASKQDTAGIAFDPSTNRIYMMMPYVLSSSSLGYAVNFIDP